MKHLLLSFSAVLIIAAGAQAQGKGDDVQNQKIKQEGTKTTQGTTQSTGGGKTIDWGAGKTKTVERLSNPYQLNARRDVLLENVKDVLQQNKIIIDEAASRPQDGILVTQPFVFAKGAVITRNELNRYAVLTAEDTSWTRGRYTLTIEIQSIDGIKNNVSVTAKVEGRSENGLQSEWTTLQSSGNAEQEFLTKLIETVTGVSPNERTPTDQ